MPVGPQQATGYPRLNRAVLIVNGREYFEWESVYVRLAVMENPPNTFRFTCSEQEPFAKDWAALRITPGAECQVILDGQVAITGRVLTRQVFYDARQHIVEIQGAGLSARSNQQAMMSKTGEFLNKDMKGLAQEAFKVAGVGVQTMGNVDSQKIQRCTIQPGESCREFIEKVARSTGTFLGENNQGQALLIGAGASSGFATVIEGKNIIEGREKIHSTQNVGA